MKILYGIQLNGNGHITRSTEIISNLAQKNHSIDIITSGNNSNLSISYSILESFEGLNLFFNKRGSIDWYKTVRTINLKRLIEDISIDTSKYDLVISDFEPITAWASKKQKTKSLNISNQISILSKKTPKINDILASKFIKYFAPCNHNIGLHYHNYDNEIYQPIISSNLLSKCSSNLDFILVYLPAYDVNYLIKLFSNFKEINWKIYSNQIPKFFSNNVEVKTISYECFQNDFINCNRIITASGFSTTSESLVLNKTLWSIPLKKQFEQQCNAKALKSMGVFTDELNLKSIQNWIDNYKEISYDWKNPIESIINVIESI
jgi:uncharacterized protein (TIGR00661 family)